jgi:predicted transcriptional regulator
MSPGRLDVLSRREREIMDAIFANGNRASAEDVRRQLADPPSYSAVRTMLARLEEKGYVRHQQEGLRYVYSAVTSPAAAKRDALSRSMRVFFKGSRSQMITTLIRQEPWTEQELDALQAEIERVRKERKS